MNTSNLITQNSNDTSTQASTQVSEKDIKASMSAEEKKLYMRKKDAERKRRKRLEEKEKIYSLTEEEMLTINKTGNSLDFQVNDENSRYSNNLFYTS